jgi:hypothetical protein
LGAALFRASPVSSIPTGYPPYTSDQHNPTWFTSTLKMEAIDTSETMLTTYTSTQHHNPEDDNPVSCCENLKSHVHLSIMLLTCYPKFSWYSSASPGKWQIHNLPMFSGLLYIIISCYSKLNNICSWQSLTFKPTTTNSTPYHVLRGSWDNVSDVILVRTLSESQTGS